MDDTRRQLVDNVRIAISNHKDEQKILKATVDLIDGFSEGFDWTGVYMMKDGILEVGPYVGPETPHTKIEPGLGICGAAAIEKKSIVVNNVNTDPRFLACSIRTKSEIVVPMMDSGKVLGEIDIDSNQPSFFKDADRVMLEQIAELIVNRLKDIR